MTRPTVCSVAAQSLIVMLAGIAAGLVANALSPRGISLTRNYFPDAARATRAPAAPPVSTTTRANEPPAPTADAPVRLARSGIPLLDHARSLELFRDPRRAEGRILFVDARDDRHFQEGHIPGAIQFDHYRMEKHIAEVLPACQIAEQIVVYCNGGACEDSELVALDLLQLGIPATKLAVYLGGIAEWKRRGLPLATGERSPQQPVPR